VSFADWVNNGWLVAHNSSKQEIGNLLGIVARDLKDSQAKDVSDDWRFAIAYNAALQAATAALAAAGYRASRENTPCKGVSNLGGLTKWDTGAARQLKHSLMHNRMHRWMHNKWWALSDLNGRPFGCKPNALTAELSALYISNRTGSGKQRQRSPQIAFFLSGLLHHGRVIERFKCAPLPPTGQ
jgi:hypothetical protein